MFSSSNFHASWGPTRRSYYFANNNGGPPLANNHFDWLQLVNFTIPYNIILERDWLTHNKVVCLLYHLVMKFPIEHGVAEVRGDQQLSKECMCVALKRQS